MPANSQQVHSSELEDPEFGMDDDSDALKVRADLT
jgi:hypothetical protein